MHGGYVNMICIKVYNDQSRACQSSFGKDFMVPSDTTKIFMNKWEYLTYNRNLESSILG